MCVLMCGILVAQARVTIAGSRVLGCLSGCTARHPQQKQAQTTLTVSGMYFALLTSTHVSGRPGNLAPHQAQSPSSAPCLTQSLLSLMSMQEAALFFLWCFFSRALCVRCRGLCVWRLWRVEWG